MAGLARAQRKLTRGQIVVIVAVAALVLGFAILLLIRLGDGSGQATAAPTEQASDVDASPDGERPSGDDERPSDDASPDGDRASAPAPAHEVPTTFHVPSGNIVCAITADSADCVIHTFDFEPEDDSCEATNSGGHLRVEPAGASVPCSPLVVAGNLPELDYGEDVSANGYTCTSQRDGVTCTHDETGYGFSLARADYELID